MITLSPSQSTTISNCLVTSSLLKSTFGTSNAQLQTISSYLAGNAATTTNSTASSTASNSTCSNTTSSTGTNNSAVTSGITASSLLGSLIDTLA